MLYWRFVKKLPRIEQRLRILEENLYAEIGSRDIYYPNILTFEETVEWILKNSGSICRFGDGELNMAMGRNMLFQVHDKAMQERMLQVLENPVPNCLCCMTDIFGSLATCRYDIQLFSREMASLTRKHIFPKIKDKYVLFGNTESTRPYWPSLDIERAKRVFELWKRVFKDRNIIIVEGSCTRFGVGNDLFDGAASIRRILCPPTNAFTKYQLIIDEVRERAEKSDLILLALGGTATIMAYDLSIDGYQAIDIGHLDIQYSYMLMGVKDRVMVPGKYTAECGGFGTSQIAERTDKEKSQLLVDLSK